MVKVASRESQCISGKFGLAVARGEADSRAALFLFDQAIAHSRFRDKQVGLGGIRFEFFAQMRQVNTEVVGVIHVVGPPDFTENLPMGQAADSSNPTNVTKAIV